ncbi:lysozyme [Wenjunlia tyrosinilytica]|uniref:Lysozyme n=1 Tax=Wenjunlia tyrosinilytica TaxID=1544741 RepID=A0A918DV33_9ACTN|nr:lysozyme [Wenjunlia tyrosinilytica]GGO85482.1 hydrolase [Wenjunlia tyrosinilytica]
MLVHRPGSARRSPRTALMALPAVFALVITLPATATAGGRGRIPHPEADWAGSTVLAHEGGGSDNDPPRPRVAQTGGMDVSSHQGNVDWATAWNNGARFAYVKATEGTTYTNPYFAQQYNGSYNVGMIRGAYHFALPDVSSGAAQADYFVDHGGGWSRDGRTLPPALDIEYNPYGATCYGLSQAGMTNWIRDFSNTVLARTGRYPTIYTSTNWWVTCTGNSSGFGATNPLWIARYSSSPGTLPAGWAYHTIWQYASSGTFPGDQDWFNGAYDRLQALANG